MTALDRNGVAVPLPAVKKRSRKALERQDKTKAHPAQPPLPLSLEELYRTLIAIRKAVIECKIACNIDPLRGVFRFQ
jgi:hypothetical protein